MKCEWALKPTRSDSAIRAALAPPSAQEVQRENVGGHIMQMFFHPHSYLQYNVSTYNRYSLGLARCLKHVDLMNVKCILCMIDSICQKHLESQAISTIFHSNINKIQSIRFYCNTFLCKPKSNHKCNHSFFLIVIYFILIALGWPYVTISLVLFVSPHFSPQWRRFAGSQLGWKHALRPV